MIYVGIDVASTKHDCFIVNSEGEVIEEVFTIANNKAGFEKLLSKIPKVNKSKIKIGLESTGHYSNNIRNYLYEKGFNLVVLNPLSTNLYRKAQTLRKTKTDKIDAKMIAKILHTEDHKPYTPISYHINEIKSLTRIRTRWVKICSSHKISITRILSCTFPELKQNFPSIHQKSMYEALKEYPSAESLKNAHLTKLTNILTKNSNGKYTKDTAIKIKKLAQNSIGVVCKSHEMDLVYSIEEVQACQKRIKNIEQEIKGMMTGLDSPILSIPGISIVYGSIILSEIGSIHNFSSPSKLLAYAGLDPSTKQSGKFKGNGKMVKRGSTYLRAALISAARSVAMYDSVFKDYLNKKLNEGKHYFVALSHVARKLIRVIYHLLRNNVIFKAS
ncbi:IS110 family transposase [Clostridium sp. 'deep sea']|nr:IS110 family transposase [Clostridium sp. 'deep sea']